MLKTLIMAGVAAAVMTSGSLWAQLTPGKDYLTYDNFPKGSAEAPLVLRGFVENIGLDDEVMGRHAKGEPSPNYSPNTGLMGGGNYKMLEGIPAMISVNLGDRLSYGWDTTECRLLYAWSGGFLDMTPHWGQKNSGKRAGYAYTSRLVGQLFYKAVGPDPLRINGKSVPEKIRYEGHRRMKGHPHFSYTDGERSIIVSLMPGKTAQSLVMTFTSSKQDDVLSYEDPKTPVEVLESGKGRLSVLVRPNTSVQYTGFKKEVIKIATPTAEIGEKLYTQFGCIACHTTDGGNNHGPTLKGVVGSKKEFEDADALTADVAYVRESIKSPGVKTVKGFPKGMMPAYPLDEKQIESLVLYIQSLK